MGSMAMAILNCTTFLQEKFSLKNGFVVIHNLHFVLFQPLFSHFSYSRGFLASLHASSVEPRRKEKTQQRKMQLQFKQNETHCYAKLGIIDMSSLLLALTGAFLVYISHHVKLILQICIFKHHITYYLALIMVVHMYPHPY